MNAAMSSGSFSARNVSENVRAPSSASAAASVATPGRIFMRR
jgi:hypothetical protein